MGFEVIKGGLYVDPCADDVPCPDKPREEWTLEEEKEYYMYLWDRDEAGSMERAIKQLDLDPVSLRSAVQVLELIKDAFLAEVEKAGFRNDWDTEGVGYILQLLKIKGALI